MSPQCGQSDFFGCADIPTPPAEPPSEIASALRGIARLAADSVTGLERNDVDYRWMEIRSTLNRVKGTRAFFEWSINPYRGCEFGCAYCYARYTHEFMEHDGPRLFERRIYLKKSAAARLRRELDKGRVAEGETIAIGAATDPYQPAERKFEITRSILETLMEYSGFRIGITTKSDLVARDTELLRELADRHAVRVRITITTTDAALARKLEPRAPTPRARLAALSKLCAAGIVAGVNLMPVLPGITDEESALESVARATVEAGSRALSWSPLFLTSCSRPTCFEFVRSHYPDLMGLYRAWYENGTDAPAEYHRDLARKMDRILARTGLMQRSGRDELDDIEGPRGAFEAVQGTRWSVGFVLSCNR